MLSQESRHQGEQMTRGIATFPNRMGAIRIGHHGKRLVVMNQPVHEFLESLVVTVVISGPMNDQKVPFQVLGKVNR